MHKENILVIGGKQAGKRISSTEIYSPLSNEWFPGDIEMLSPRSGFSAISISSNTYLDDIYIVGGSDGVPLKNFEM